MLTYLTGDVRLTDESAGQSTRYLHADQLGSIIGISDSSGASAERRAYHPFGKIAWEVTLDIALTEEDKGFLGERYDEHAELQFLNNRYYDPELALFIQPDWLGVTEPGVGTNRYAYANNDPVNRLDPEGNSWLSNIIGIALSFIPGLQPAGAALIAAGLSAVETVAAGGDLGDALKSATITFAMTMVKVGVQESGLFGLGDATDAVTQSNDIIDPYISTRNQNHIPIPAKPNSRIMRALGAKEIDVPADVYEKIQTVHGLQAPIDKSRFLPHIAGHPGATRAFMVGSMNNVGVLNVVKAPSLNPTGGVIALDVRYSYPVGLLRTTRAFTSTARFTFVHISPGSFSMTNAFPVVDIPASATFKSILP